MSISAQHCRRVASPETATDSSLAALATAIASVGRPGFEADLCSLLEAATGYSSIAIIAFSAPGKPRRLFDTLTRRDQQRSLEPYLGGAYLLDPWYNRVLRQGSDGVYLLAEHAPHDFEQSEYFRRYYQHAGLQGECAMFIRLSPQACIVISLAVYGAEAPVHRDLHEARALFACIRMLCLRHWGDRPLESAEPRATLEELCRSKGLSGREVEVTAMVLQGYSNKQVARALEISPGTVKVYRKRINRKLGICSSRELFASFFAFPTCVWSH